MVTFLVAWVVVMVVQKLFFSLEFEVLRGSIVGLGAAIWYYFFYNRKSK